jgi:hypothetical protein
MDEEDDFTTQEDEYVYHKTFGRVLLIRVLADKQRAWVEKRKERTLVQVVDLQTTPFPEEKSSKPAKQAA